MSNPFLLFDLPSTRAKFYIFAFLIIALPAVIFYSHKVNLNRIKQLSQSLVSPSHGKRV